MNKVSYEFNALTISALDNVINNLSDVLNISVVTRSEEHAIIMMSTKDGHDFIPEELVVIGSIIGQVIIKSLNPKPINNEL